MKGIIAAAGIFVAVTLYSCIWAGAQEDRRTEEIKRRGEWDAGRMGSQPKAGRKAAGARPGTGKEKKQEAGRNVSLLVDIEAKMRAGKGKGYERWAKV